MELEESIYGTNSIQWEEIETIYKDIVDWMKDNDDPKYPASHFWWEILTKQQYHIPPFKFDEFLSEIAKAIERKEIMKVVETRDHIRNYKLHIDLDLKTSENTWSQNQVLEFFKNEIQETVKKALVDLKIEYENISFVCTGASGRFFSSSNPDITNKYGYHFIWPYVFVNAQQHREIISQLMNRFKYLEENPKENSEEISFQDFRPYNDWHEIFDTSILDNEVSGFRMLYSIKSFTCKMCQKKENSKKKSKGKSKKTQVDGKQCPNCLDTGMLDRRFVNFY